jgi:hypothetical protein
MASKGEIDETNIKNPAALLVMFLAACTTTGDTVYTSIRGGAHALVGKLEISLPAGQSIAFISPGTSALEDFFLDEIAQLLIHTKKYTILDRQTAGQIALEQGFQLSGSVRDEDVQALGEAIGARIIVALTITELTPAVRFRVRVVDIVTRIVQTGDSVDVKDPHAIRLLHESDARPLWQSMQSANTVQTEIPQTVPDPVSPPFEGDSLPAITIRNNTGTSIFYLFLKPLSSDSLVRNWLGQLEIIDNRDSISLILDEPLSVENRYNIQLIDRYGTAYIKRDVIVTDGSVFVFDKMDIAKDEE